MGEVRDFQPVNLPPISSGPSLIGFLVGLFAAMLPKGNIPAAVIDCAGRTVWGEARGAGHDCMVAVAWVIKNRAAAPGWWGHDVIGVCTKPYQFSCRLPSDPNCCKLLAVNDKDPYFVQSKTICRQVLSGAVPDPTDGCTYYYDARMPAPPKWAVGHTAHKTFGHLLFFKGI